MVTPAALALALLPGALESRVGAVFPSKDRICLAIANSRLKPRSPVSVVVNSAQQEVVTAWVDARGCPNEADLPREFTLYRLGVPPREEALSGVALIGVSLERDGNRVRGDIDGDGAPEYFRECASQEGVHYTVWSGTRRRWHFYLFVGYDLEPSCSAEDTR